MAQRPATPAHPRRLRATFRTVEDVADAVERLHQQGVADDDIKIDDTDDRQYMLVRQQQQESGASVPITGNNVFTAAQAKGALLWTFAGLGAGAAVGALGLFMTLGDFSRPVSIALFAVVGALAGASAGFVYGGGRQPEVNGELRDHSLDHILAVAPTTPDDAAAALRAIESSAATDAEYETYADDPLAGGFEPR